MPFTPEHQARIDAGRRATYARRRAEWEAMTEDERWDSVMLAFSANMPPQLRDGLRVTDCVPWNIYCVERNTYGTFMRSGLGDYTHRLSYRLAHGPIPVGAVVRHSCDWKPCVNPDHLLIGSQGDNIQDTYDRGRPGSGQKISDAQVRELDARYRAGGVSMTQLALDYGVSVPTVSEIVNRKKRARAFLVG